MIATVSCSYTKPHEVGGNSVYKMIYIVKRESKELLNISSTYFNALISIKYFSTSSGGNETTFKYFFDIFLSSNSLIYLDYLVMSTVPLYP